MEESNAVSTPVDCGIKLSRYNKGSNVDATYFKNMVGSLRYLAYTRPDILYRVRLVSLIWERQNLLTYWLQKGSCAALKEQ